MKVEVSAIKSLDDFLAAAPDVTKRAAALAMNTIIPRKGMKRYKDAMKSQIAFPAGYLEDPDRFDVTRSATPERLESVISARHRPTSLARFVTSGSVNVPDLAVKVKANRTVRLQRAFLVRLRAGSILDSETSNLGLAVRVPDGKLRNKKDQSNTVQLAKNVFLLYAPSVNQVFRTVSQTETPAVLDEIEAEFFRQFGRLS